MKKIELWMRDIQRWNVIFILAVGENMKHIQNLIGLNNIFEYFVYVTIQSYYIRPTIS